MLLGNQKQTLAQAWRERCQAEAHYRLITHECNVQCRAYFSNPASLVWPFAVGVILMRFSRAAPQAVKASSLALSIAQLAARAAPLVREWVR